MGRRSSSANGGTASKRSNHTQARKIYPISMSKNGSATASSTTSSSSNASGGFLSNLASNITSIALGHALGRAISSVFEGNESTSNTETFQTTAKTEPLKASQHKEAVSPKCMDYHKLWEQCLSINDSKESSCADYMEMLRSCNEQQRMKF